MDDLIKKAGGFTNNAYPLGAVFENMDAKNINIRAQELLYQEFLDNIIAHPIPTTDINGCLRCKGISQKFK